MKLDKRTFPSGHGPNDFECFGPPATKDGEFENCKLADLGCFNQEESDSNKFYHGAIVKSKINKQWFVYFEWGRTGKQNNDFQFVQCGTESEAQKEFASQLHSKNDKRGEWATIGGIRTLRAKPGKDCYLVRPQAVRSVGLPDARKIAFTDNAQPVKSAKTKSKSKSNYDNETIQLMRDLNVATMQYARTNLVGGAIPTQSVIEEGRAILNAAQQRLSNIGNVARDQINDRELRTFTYTLYSRIPKVKPVKAHESTWILSQDNILIWQQDLDAFESALKTADFQVETEEDPLGGLPIEMSWLSPTTPLGKFIHEWAPKATRNKHGHIGGMSIKNIWKVKHLNVSPNFEKAITRIASDCRNVSEKPDNQPRNRIDTVGNLFEQSNTALLFHGTRSVNVSGILREGLRLPKQLVGVVITGAMFGGGAYFADDWKKSAGYTSLHGSYWSNGSGAVKGRNAFMFLCDVILGNPHVAPGPRGYTGPPNGHHSVFGKAGFSQVQNNEWIIYDASQHQPRYLVEFNSK